MTLPLLTVAVLFVVLLAQEAGAYSAASAITRAVDLQVKLDTLVDGLQQERALTLRVLTGDQSASGPLTAVRAQVDADVTLLRSVTGPAAASLRAAMSGLEDIGTQRGKIDGNRLIRSAAFEYYTSQIVALNGVDVGVVGHTTDEQLQAYAATAQALRDGKESAAQENAYLFSVISEGGFGPGEYRAFVAMNAGLRAAESRFAQTADQAQSLMLASTMETSPGRTFDAMQDQALDALDISLGADPQEWARAASGLVADLRTDQNQLSGELTDRARTLQRNAGTALVVLISFAGLSAIGAAILLFSAARSITRPLAALSAEALTMATIRLPEAVSRLQAIDSGVEPEPPPRVTVSSRSSTEISAVADALDSAQTTAYELATEQARLRRSTSESLANLGRRNQNLLRRQLGFITQLEREETDPSGLANLFELDHLATRMRRNAESLLVLVGESSPRTWSEALPVADVLRAAISEVEDYRRVTLKRVDDAFVGGAFVSGIAHMIAELVENGLAFSPPDVDVEIQGRLLPGRYLIGITDQGLGMDPEDMARANARLRGEESFLSAPTRYLGHYVVGHLARQMGIDVELTSSPVTGVAARVLLPAGVLASRPAIGLFDGRPSAVRPSPTGDLRTGPEARTGAALAIDSVAVESSDADKAELATVGARAATNGAAVNGGPRAQAPNWATASTGELPTQQADTRPEWPPTAPPPAPPTQPVASTPSTPSPVSTPSTPSSLSASEDIAAQLAHGTGERTRNGLVKRVPRPRRPGPDDGPVVEAPPEGTADEAAAQMRSRLTSLRAGVARGVEEHAAGGRPADDPGSTPETGSEAERSSHAR
jgi:signal transduction histidine kinase